MPLTATRRNKSDCYAILGRRAMRRIAIFILLLPCMVVGPASADLDVGQDCRAFATSRRLLVARPEIALRLLLGVSTARWLGKSPVARFERGKQ